VVLFNIEGKKPSVENKSSHLERKTAHNLKNCKVQEWFRKT